jgi:antitoxin ParD1/3/4
MSKLERITVTMPEEMVARLRAAVDSGQYATTSEVVREALRDWGEQEDLRQAKLERLKALVAEAEASESLDGPAVMAEMREYVAQLVAHERGNAGIEIDEAA